MKTKILSLLIAFAMLVTVGGVYATWTYTQATDVADEAVNMSLNLSTVTYVGTYGTYEIDQSGVTMTIDPKEGTTHTTALYITGDLVVKFTPNTYAPTEIKENGVDSTYTFSLANTSWKYENTNIVSLNNATGDVSWTKEADGTFTKTFSATELSSIINLTEFTLDTKNDYDAYNTVLGQGSIVISISDGQTASGN